jgi:hypothetical protein
MNVEYDKCSVRTDIYFVANNVLLCCVFCGMVWMCFDVLRFVVCSALFLPVCKVMLFVLNCLCAEFCSIYALTHSVLSAALF